MNTKKFLSEIASSTGRQTLGMLRGVVIIPLITKLLGIGQFGIWVTLTGVVGIVSGISSLNLSAAIVRYTPDEARTGQTLVDILSLTVVGSTGIAAVLVGVLLLFPSLLSGVGTTTIFALGTVALTRGLEKVVIDYPRAIDQVRTKEAIQSLKILIEATGLVAAFLLFESIAAGLFAIALTSALVTGSILLKFMPQHPPLPNTSNFRQYFEFSLPLLPQTLAGRLIRNGDKFLVLYFVGPAGAGVYGIAATVGNLIENVSQVVNPALYPKVVRGWENEDTIDLKRLYNQLFRWFILLGVPAVVGVSLLAGDIVSLLAEPGLAGEALLPVVGMSLAYGIIGLSRPFLFIFFASEKTGLLAKMYTSGAILNVGLNLLLIPIYGILGAVLTTIMTFSLFTVLILWYAGTLVSFKIPIPAIVRALLASAAMSGLLFFVPSWLSSVERLVLVPVLGAVAYFVVVASLGEFDRREIEKASSIIRNHLPV